MQQNLVNEAPAKRNYDFIDHIRCLAMMSIVGEHSFTAGTADLAAGTAKYWVNIIVIQIIKFGTITFFLLAGFLISEKFTDYTPAQYLKRRVSTTVGPWVFWSLAYVAIMVWGIHIKDHIYHDGQFNLANILDQISIVYLYSNYWFIINFLISITILLIFRRYLYSFYFGGVLLMLTLFYTINIHYEWVSPKHTTAILGFVFFLWLGAQLRRYWDNVEARLKTIPYWLIVIAVLLTLGLSVYETLNLFDHSVDPYNTLRISNILYSLVFFALLLKIKKFKYLDRLKPRQTTYGIYLIHYMVVAFLLPELFIHLDIDVDGLNVGLFLLYKASCFLITYFVAFYATLLISRSRAKALVGN